VEHVTVVVAMGKAPGERGRTVAALGGGGMAAGTSLVVEPLTRGNGRGIAAEWVACGVGLLRGERHRERCDAASSHRQGTCRHAADLYHR
jgi:hypothetical protein